MEFGTIRKSGIGINLTRHKLHVSNGYRKDFRNEKYTESESASLSGAKTVLIFVQNFLYFFDKSTMLNGFWIKPLQPVTGLYPLLLMF